MRLRFSDEKGNILVSPFHADRIPLSGETVRLGDRLFVITQRAPENGICSDSGPTTMITTVFVKPAPIKADKRDLME